MTNSDKYSIEVVHSKWGNIKLEAKLETLVSRSEEDAFEWDELCFYYPSGQFMGSWDEERGGNLGHPNEEVNKFMREHNLELFEMERMEYYELEDVLEKAAKTVFPTFFAK